MSDEQAVQRVVEDVSLVTESVRILAPRAAVVLCVALQNTDTAP